MFNTCASMPAVASSVSLSISNISHNLSYITRCKAKDRLLNDVSEHVAKVTPKMMMMDFSGLEDYDSYLREKAIEAAKMRTCAQHHPEGLCDKCPIMAKFCTSQKNS